MGKRVGIQRGSAAITATRRAQYLDHLRKYGNVTAAARHAGFDPSTAYTMRERDQGFAEAWEAALAEAYDSLEAEAWRRGRDGVPKLVVSMGRVLTDKEGDPLVELNYSDAILLRLLQAHKPAKFTPAATAQSNVVPPDLQPDPAPTPDEPAPEKPIL